MACLGPGQPAALQPGGVARLDRAGAPAAAFQQPRHDGLGVVGVGQGPARAAGRPARAEAEVARGGDGGRDAEFGRDRACQARWRRDGRRAAARPRSRPRPPRPPAARLLVAQERGHGADQDAAGAQADDRQRRPRTGRARCARGLGEADVGRAVGAGGAWISAAGQARPQPRGQGGAARAQGDDRRRRRSCAAARFRPARIREK